MTILREGSLNFEKTIKELTKLNQFEVVVGFFGDSDAQLLTIIRANEYGAHIVPKKHKYLYVPYRKTDGSKGLYKLKKVNIPARPFIRTAWLNNKDKYRRLIVAGLDHIVSGDMTARQLLNELGSVSVADIRKSARDWFRTGTHAIHNAPLTIANKKGNDKPLVDTGELIRKVTYKIVMA